jgi:hypothetical protein
LAAEKKAEEENFLKGEWGETAASSREQGAAEASKPF